MKSEAVELLNAYILKQIQNRFYVVMAEQLISGLTTGEPDSASRLVGRSLQAAIRSRIRASANATPKGCGVFATRKALRALRAHIPKSFRAHWTVFRFMLT